MTVRRGSQRKRPKRSKKLEIYSPQGFGLVPGREGYYVKEDSVRVSKGTETLDKSMDCLVSTDECRRQDSSSKDSAERETVEINLQSVPRVWIYMGLDLRSRI